MRSIINETAEQQVQSDENGREYIYRKDFVAGGDMTNEFSLSLVYSRVRKIPDGQEQNNFETAVEPATLFDKEES